LKFLELKSTGSKSMVRNLGHPEVEIVFVMDQWAGKSRDTCLSGMNRPIQGFGASMPCILANTGR
jgi:hypothetical protein